MGKRGPKPKPAAILQLAGSRHISKKTGERIPSRKPAGAGKKEPPAIGKPRRPAKLTRRERTLWDRFIRDLTDLRVLGRTDQTALLSLVQTTARVEELTRFIQANGSTFEITDRDGNVIPRARPETRELHEALRLQINLLVQFGLTPSARTGVSMQEDPKKPDTKEAFLAATG